MLVEEKVRICLDEDDLIEKELEDGIELAVEDDKIQIGFGVI